MRAETSAPEQVPQCATHRSASRVPAGNRSVLAIATVWFGAQCTLAPACQVCSATMSYDALRFGVFWFYLLPIWTALATVADAQIERRSPSAIPSVRSLHSGRAILLVLIALAASVIGLHFFALLYFPLLLWPYCAPPKRLKNPLSRAKAQHAPQWLRRAAQITAALLAIAIVPSYFLFPFLPTEAMTRSMVSLTRNEMRALSAAPPKHTLDGFVVRTERERAAIAQAISEGLETVQWRTLPGWIAAAIFFPYAIISPHSLRYPESRMPAVLIRYAPVGADFVLWSQGPDGRFDPRFLEAVRSKAAGLTTATALLANLTYDPTNGTVSPGELYRFSSDRPGLSRSFGNW